MMGKRQEGRNGAWRLPALAVLTLLLIAGQGQAAEPEPTFPELSLDFFDATTIHPDARGFQVAFYEKNQKRAIFIPWGPSDHPLGVLLAYHTERDFLSPSSYQAVDLTKLVHPDAQGPGAAFMDDSQTWLYMPAFRKNADGQVVANGLTVRFNLTKALDDPTAYETFDLTTLNLPRIGWVHGAYADGNVDCAEPTRTAVQDVFREGRK